MSLSSEAQAPLVSVIIPCYQAVGYIEQTIASAFEQSYTQVDVIVVDDGSKDGSYELVTRLKRERFPALKILTHENRANLGVSTSRYLGLIHAEGELIAFLDADDEFTPDKLSKQVHLLQASPDVVLCHTAVCAIDDEDFAPEQEEHFAEHPEQPYLIRRRRRYLNRNGICTSTVLACADELRRVPFAMPQLFQYEDWLCWVLLGRYGKFLFLNERLTLYRLHPASATSAVQRSLLKAEYSMLELKLALAARFGIGAAQSQVLGLCGHVDSSVSPGLPLTTGLPRPRSGLSIEHVVSNRSQACQSKAWRPRSKGWQTRPESALRPLKGVYLSNSSKTYEVLW